MPASIFGDRFVGFRQPAWHGLGEVFTDRINVSEAVARAKVGFEIHKAQNFARMDTGRFDDQGRPIVHSVPTNSYSVGFRLDSEAGHQYIRHEKAWIREI